MSSEAVNDILNSDNPLEIELPDMTKENSIEQAYPSIDLGYSIAINSYEMILKRLDAIDSRLQTMLTLGIAVTLPLSTLASSKNLSLNSNWFIAAVVIFVIAIGIGTYARLSGNIMLLVPEVIYQGWLHLEQPDFKVNMIYRASEHFKHNKKLLDKRARLLTATTLLFFGVWLLLGIWAIYARS